MTLYVICPDIPGLPDYLTAGKRYEVEQAIYNCIWFRDDREQRRYSSLRDSIHLGGECWIIQNGANNASTPKPNWSDLGPRMLSALGLACIEAEANAKILQSPWPAWYHIAKTIIKEAEGK